MADLKLMTSGEPTFKKNELSLMAVLALVAMTLITMAVVPSFRTNFKGLIANKDRKVLAKAYGLINREGPEATVLKILSNGSLSLEIYENNPDAPNLLTKIPLEESRDGFFLLQGNATNLAITDIDNDGQIEVVAPTYDSQMIPRLNIFRYNKATKSFDRVNAP
ncbi:MAG: hypothetical protein ACXVCP_13615 [Bdellovibrio sp.]